MATETSAVKNFFARFFFVTAAILCADLAVQTLAKIVLGMKDRFDTHLVTLMGMGIAVGLFYLFFLNLDKLSRLLVTTLVQLGRIYFGRWLGFLLAIFGTFYAVYAGYYWVWFDKNFFVESFTFVQQWITSYQF